MQILRFLASIDLRAVSALVVGFVALIVARKTLKDAEEFWKQQKWFDLYAKADEGHDAFDRYFTAYKVSPHPETHIGHTEAWNNLMFLIRRVHSMAMVFPQHPAINKLVKATSFDMPADALDEWRLSCSSKQWRTCEKWQYLTRVFSKYERELAFSDQ